MKTDTQKISGWAWHLYAICNAMTIVLCASHYLIIQVDGMRPFLLRAKWLYILYWDALIFSQSYSLGFACPVLWAIVIWVWVQCLRSGGQLAVGKQKLRWLMVMFGVVATTYFHLKFWQQFHSEDWCQGWLISLHDWLVRAYHSPSGSIKLNGEIYRLKLIVCSVTTMSCLLTMLILDPIVRLLNREVDGRHCPMCDYDLRGTQPLGISICPECGQVCQFKTSANCSTPDFQAENDN